MEHPRGETNRQWMDTKIKSITIGDFLIIMALPI